MSRFEFWVVGIYSFITVSFLSYNPAFLVATPLLITVLPVVLLLIWANSGGLATAVLVAVAAFALMFIGVINGTVYVAEEGDKLLFVLWPIVWLGIDWRLLHLL